MLAGRKAGLAICPYRKTAVLLGRLAPWKGRASNLLVAGHQAVPIDSIALPKGGAFFFDFRYVGDLILTNHIFLAQFFPTA
jgi:hypothetical protein